MVGKGGGVTGQRGKLMLGNVKRDKARSLCVCSLSASCCSGDAEETYLCALERRTSEKKASCCCCFAFENQKAMGRLPSRGRRVS